MKKPDIKLHSVWVSENDFGLMDPWGVNPVVKYTVMDMNGDWVKLLQTVQATIDLNKFGVETPDQFVAMTKQELVTFYKRIEPK